MKKWKRQFGKKGGVRGEPGDRLVIHIGGRHLHRDPEKAGEFGVGLHNQAQLFAESSQFFGQGVQVRFLPHLEAFGTIQFRQEAL